MNSFTGPWQQADGLLASRTAQQRSEGPLNAACAKILLEVSREVLT